MRAVADSLALYRIERNFLKTPDPSGDLGTRGTTLAFVIQKHAAMRLHYDFRLELDRVMLSWAAPPRGPAHDPRHKCMGCGSKTTRCPTTRSKEEFQVRNTVPAA